MKLEEILNKDINLHIINIKNKYSEIVNIIQNKEIDNKNKQKKIEEYCSSLKSINLEKYKIFPQINNLTENIMKDLFIRENIDLNNLLTYIGNLDAIILYTFNECILNEAVDDDDFSINYTKLVFTLLNNIEKHYNFIKISEYSKDIKKIKNIEPNLFNCIKESDFIILLYIIMRESEKCKILHLGFKKTEKRCIRIVTFTPEYVSRAYRDHIHITNLPMIYKPCDWSVTSNKITSFGGYLCNKDQNIIDLVHYNKDRSKLSLLKDDYINQINYLQSQKFIIDKKNLLNYKNDITTFLNKEILIVKDFHEYKEINDPANIINNKMAFKEYTKRIYEIKLLIETLFLANIYKNEIIYFPIYNDFRNRLYYHSFPLNVQGSKFSRSLISLNNYNNEDLRSLDATASGLQILSIIIKDKKIMNLTNLSGENNLNIYEYFKNEFNKSEINFLQNVIYTKKNIRIKIKQNKFLFNEKTNKLFKKLLMTYAYNKEVYGMCKDIEESEVYDLTPTEIYYHMNNLFNFFKKEFTKIQILKSLIKDVIKYTDNDFLILNQDSNFISTQFYSKQISKQITRTYQKERFSMTIKTDIKPRQINKSKTERATMPNLIHSIDAQILYNVIKKLRNEEIPVYTIHDCFVVPKEYVLKVKKIYLNELQNIFNSNILQKFINNNVCNEKYRNKIYEKYKDILKEGKIELNNIKCLKEEKIEIINIKSSKEEK